ncbi:N-acetylmuramoyl-L-alanine amidase [Chitinophaga nivalis]|uniref:N-acetylmuramoyl-L-alanine amidase n=1 Tax=Chitinophaga nivalis TaxID=2991709 RepID=A0ABT3IFD7_9BACT|nr:N-acetylmuramoyl-L-alanine amidase [Chitinophaga nivalis]MCW3467634.1 N-acetylmuramoyl-L-alanine amidase [Chitinophaga nivalis]MCW3482674.1 N-acetylmuramoyl-L-alanine amidase [Chitinophaga nivalis]
MRTIKFIVIHCTATPQNTRPEAIQRYWREQLQWKNPGYHYLIDPAGTVIQLATADRICNGVAGYNASSLHISYIGGVDATNKPTDNRTTAQRAAMHALVAGLKQQFPTAIVQGHRDFPLVKKACPSFDAKKEFNHL